MPINIFLIFLLTTAVSLPLRAQLPDAAVTPESSPAASPAVPALSQSIFLDVKDLGTNISSSTNWQSSWGSFSKDYQKARGLELTFRNPAKINGEYLVQWYFFATPMKGGARFLYDTGTKTLSLTPGATQKVTVLSAELESHKTHYAGDYYYSGSSYKTGKKPEGWAVTVKIADKIIRVKTANAQIDAIFADPNQVQAYVDKMKPVRQRGSD